MPLMAPAKLKPAANPIRPIRPFVALSKSILDINHNVMRTMLENQLREHKTSKS